MLEELELSSWLPKRIRKCPRCGDRDPIQFILFGLPLGRPPASEEDRIIMAGCLIRNADSPLPRWHCPTCRVSYSGKGELVELPADEPELP